MEDKKEETKNVTAKVEHTNIYSALSAFQGEMKPIEKDGHVKFKTKGGEEVDFKYTTLGKIMEVINPVLGKHGLSVRWLIQEKGIECLVTHSSSSEKDYLVSEEFIPQDTVGGKTEDGMIKNKLYRKLNSNEISSGLLPLDLTKPDMKDVGAQMTYGRRYTLGLALGIATEEDKDVELQEKSRVNTEKFAVKTVNEKIENAKTPEELDTNIKFLEKELKMAEDMENGIGKYPPSLGLKSEQYRELIKKANAKKNGTA